MKGKITISLEQDILDDFNKITDKNHQNKSAIIEDLISQWVKQNKK